MNGKFKIICETCGEIFPQDFYDFYDVVAFKKKEGWRSQKITGDKWIETCKDCIEVSNGKKSYY